MSEDLEINKKLSIAKALRGFRLMRIDEYFSRFKYFEEKKIYEEEFNKKYRKIIEEI